MTKRLAIVVRKRARRLLRRPCQDYKQKASGSSSSATTQTEPDPGPSEPVCRFCLEEHTEGDGDQLISPCACRGSIEFVHLACLREWVSTCNKRVGVSYKKPPAFSVACPVCLQRYRYEDQREDAQPLSQSRDEDDHHHHHPSWHRPLPARERCIASIFIALLLAAGLAVTHITDEYTAQYMQQAIDNTISTPESNAHATSLVKGLGFARVGWRMEEQVLLAMRCMERTLHKYVETNMAAREHTPHTLAPNGHSSNAHDT